MIVAKINIKQERSKQFIYLSVWIILVCLISVFFQVILLDEISEYSNPIYATVVLFITFGLILRWQVGDSLFGELGFLYLALAVAYTVLPAFAFIVGRFNPGDPLAVLLPDQKELSAHLWRHVLFIFGVAVGYILARGNEKADLITIQNSQVWADRKTIRLLMGLIVACILIILISSAQVNSYYDHYTRYDHLPWLIRKFVSFCVRIKLGLYSILLTFLFLNYGSYRKIIPLTILIICTHETLYSYGSRIQTLIVILQVICLYNYTVKKITVRKGIISCFVLGALFSIMELFRSLEFDLNSAKDMVSEEGIKSASEFGSVFFTGFHLYAEREHGALPSTEWPMFFNEIISLFTFGDFLQWNPMDWYWKNYYPDSIVAPFTLGPIADSAIWGGEIDLLIRGLINGTFFAYLFRWFIRNKQKWWGVAIYIFSYASCILTLKYGVFYLLNPLSKNILPTILLVGAIRLFYKNTSAHTFHK